jgi:integrase
MKNIARTPRPDNLAQVLSLIAEADLSANQRRDMTSAINRICEMNDRSAPCSVPAEATALRAVLKKIRPAAFGIGKKTFSNQRSLLAAALLQVGVLDRLGRGCAQHHPTWAPLMRAIAPDKRFSCGLAAFGNWCAAKDISPEQVGDDSVQEFLSSLESRTLCPKPRDVVRRVPNLWNEAKDQFACWPQTTLTLLSFRPPRRRLAWDDLDERYRRDADAYLDRRANPDLFDESPNAPTRALAPSTLHQQSEHLRLAASIVVESGVNVACVASLADLVKPEYFKLVLRYYHERADKKPNAFVIAVAKTLIQVAQYHVGDSMDAIKRLRRLAGKLPPVPIDLTEKNKALLRRLESPRLRAKLLLHPENLHAKIIKTFEARRLPFVDAQVALAIDILLVSPLRPQNLCCLNWRSHFQEPEGPRGGLVIHIPADETKGRRREFVAEIPEEVAKRLRWYRRHILPRLNADPNGDLFVTKKGRPKSQETLSQQITEAISEHVGIHMTPHQFRHFAAMLYLEDRPDDLETVTSFLGHAFPTTTRSYAGSSSRRAGRVYSSYLLRRRDELKLSRTKKRMLTKRSKKAKKGLDHASP